MAPRETAAQKAKRELEEAKAKQNETEKGAEEATEGDIVNPDANAPTEENDATSGDSGADNGDDEAAEPPALPEKEKKHAVALRDLPGVGVKIGRIILAPENMIKTWDEISWIDTHEDALKLAEQRWAQQKMANPNFNEPKVYELDAAGQIMEQSDEG